MSYRFKKNLLIVIDMVTAVAIVIAVFLTASVISKINHQSVRIDQNQQQQKLDMQTDHDLQLKYVQCIANLFGSKPGQVITKKEFDACLAGTRITPSQSSNPAQTNKTETKTPTGTPVKKSGGTGSGNQPNQNKNGQGSQGSGDQSGTPQPGFLSRAACRLTLGLLCQ